MKTAAFAVIILNSEIMIFLGALRYCKTNLLPQLAEPCRTNQTATVGTVAAYWKSSLILLNAALKVK